MRSPDFSQCAACSRSSHCWGRWPGRLGGPPVRHRLRRGPRHANRSLPLPDRGLGQCRRPRQARGQPDRTAVSVGAGADGAMGAHAPHPVDPCGRAADVRGRRRDRPARAHSLRFQAARPGCTQVSRSLTEAGLPKLQSALRCLARKDAQAFARRHGRLAAHDVQAARRGQRCADLGRPARIAQRPARARGSRQAACEDQRADRRSLARRPARDERSFRARYQRLRRMRRCTAWPAPPAGAALTRYRPARRPRKRADNVSVLAPALPSAVIVRSTAE